MVKHWHNINAVTAMTTFPVTREENEIPPIHFIAKSLSEPPQRRARRGGYSPPNRLDHERGQGTPAPTRAVLRRHHVNDLSNLNFDCVIISSVGGGLLLKSVSPRLTD